MALLKGLPLNIDLAISIFKHLTKQPLFIKDLSEHDLELTKNLTETLKSENIEALDITFNHYEEYFGEIIEIDLGRQHEQLNNSNFKDYFKTIANYKMTIQIKD